MALTDIPNPTPIIKPAVDQKIFDKQYCVQLTIDAHPSKPWSAKFVGLPFDGIELERSHPFQVELKDLKALAALDPELAKILGGMVSVIGKYLVKCKIAGKHQVTVDNIEEILK